MRDELNAYDLGEPVPLRPLEERRRGVPDEVWRRLAQAKDAARAVLGDRLVEMRLFGSYARGEFDEDSDIDALVITTNLTWEERRRLVDAFVGASGDGIVLAPVILTRAELDEMRARELIFATDVDREGITL